MLEFIQLVLLLSQLSWQLLTLTVALLQLSQRRPKLPLPSHQTIKCSDILVFDSQTAGSRTEQLYPVTLWLRSVQLPTSGKRWKTQMKKPSEMLFLLTLDWQVHWKVFSWPSSDDMVTWEEREEGIMSLRQVVSTHSTFNFSFSSWSELISWFLSLSWTLVALRADWKAEKQFVYNLNKDVPEHSIEFIYLFMINRAFLASLAIFSTWWVCPVCWLCSKDCFKSSTCLWPIIVRERERERNKDALWWKDGRT